MNKQETTLIVIVFVVVFALAFSFAYWLNLQNASLYGFRVISSKPPVEAVKEVLNQNRSLVLKQELFDGETRENSAVAAASAEFSYAAFLTGTRVYNYGVVNGVNVNGSCNANNSFCGIPDIIVRIDSTASPCNCIEVREKTMYIKGSVDFLLSNAANLRNVVFLAKAPKVN